MKDRTNFYYDVDFRQLRDAYLDENVEGDLTILLVERLSSFDDEFPIDYYVKDKWTFVLEWSSWRRHTL